MYFCNVGDNSNSFSYDLIKDIPYNHKVLLIYFCYERRIEYVSIKLMENIIKIVLFIHLLGMASLVGGTLSQIKLSTKKVTPLMRDGSLTQLITGLVLVGLLQANNESINNTVISIKFTVLIAILLLIYLGRKSLSNKYYFAILILSITNVVFALFVTTK